ncbi:hypothetical protein DQ384_04575 [Sphaerisporangium album]|uniref:Uncharacterized protein n=1 Tax=Sphaerisporangium album TaxID=509200 RepID=A0A367FT46_9ACTN|nr:hypothetical protein [Sphaerisporangium album]RCG32755.1 hypothetical protein DQ384_04575 [Sphaerisporangium album]
MGEHDAFWIDHGHDRELAGEGRSRYAEHVRRNVAAFDGTWGDIAPVTFACAAWRLAITPSPPYVRRHRRVLSAACDRNPWDGTLTAHVLLVSPPPAELTASREWWRDRGWREWPQTFGQFLDPTDQDLSRSPYLRPTLVIDAPIPLNALPPAPGGPAETLPETAHLAVTALVRELNALLTPIIRRLETAQTPG